MQIYPVTKSSCGHQYWCWHALEYLGSGIIRAGSKSISGWQTAVRNSWIPGLLLAVLLSASIPAAAYSISGNAGIAGATVTAGSVSVTADSSGNFTFSGLGQAPIR